MHSGIANFDLSRVARSRVTSSLDDKMASAADASTGNSETKTQINFNWTNDEVAAIIDIWANVEIRCCTLIALLNVVSLRRTNGPNSSQSSMNVVFDIRRFDTNMASGQAPMSIVSPAFLAHQLFRGKVHTGLSGAHDNRALRITIRVNRFLLRWLYRRTRFACRFCDKNVPLLFAPMLSRRTEHVTDRWCVATPPRR